LAWILQASMVFPPGPSRPADPSAGGGGEKGNVT
jgi:hypothetical protein